METLAKKVVQEKAKDADGIVGELLRLRLELSKTSVKKYEAMARTVCKDGRVHGVTQFYGASRTGRWAGRLVQLQNVPQNHLPDLDEAKEVVKKSDADLVEMLYGSVPNTLSELIRTALIPREGSRFLVADFSAIEARTLAWLAGEEWVLEEFRGKGKIYEATAARMYHIPVETIVKGNTNYEYRQKGKQATLACGYGGGGGAMKNMGATMPDEELQDIVEAWRAANPHIVSYWAAMERTARRVADEHITLQCGKAILYWKDSNMFMRLPSGRDLCYQGICYTKNRFGNSSLGYARLSKTERDSIKDIGGFVGGYLKNGKRSNASIVNRCLVCLDADYGDAELRSDLELTCPFTYALYSTHSHTTEKPRFRVIIPLDRDVTPDEYAAISRRLADNLTLARFDPTTFEAARLMYWPSTPEDGEYIFDYGPGPFCSADAILETYADWHDSTLWPTTQPQDERIHSNIKKAEDPLAKHGIIGAFCRAHTISQLLETLLKDKYTPTRQEDRYTYVDGTTTGGLVVYDDKFAFSHHATDPASGKLCNAFDLIRWHFFAPGVLSVDGHNVKDEKASVAMMQEYAANDPATKVQLAKDRADEIMSDFTPLEPATPAVQETGQDGNPPEPAKPADPNEWVTKLEYKKLSDICVSMKASDHLKMPEKVDNIVEVTLSAREMKLYKQMERDMLLPYTDGDILALNAAVLANKLLQLANGACYDEFHNVRVIHDKKLDAMEDLIEAANGKPVLVMYGYKHDLDRIQHRFGAYGPDCPNGVRRLISEQDMKDWCAGLIPIAATQPASTGHGLNLQSGGSTIIWYGLTWSLELYEQANARLWRQGQKNTVVIHHIVAKGTMDERAMRALHDKAVGQDALLDAVKARIREVV